MKRIIPKTDIAKLVKKTIGLSVITIIALILLCILIGTILLPRCYWQMSGEIKDLYKTEYNGLSPDKIVNGFDLYRDTFHFPNFYSALSKGGNCHGIAYMQKALFEKNEGVLQGIDINKRPGEYSLSPDEINSIYKTNSPDQIFNGILYPIRVPKFCFPLEYYSVTLVKDDDSQNYLETTNILEEANTSVFNSITMVQEELSSKKIVNYYKNAMHIHSKDDVEKLIDLLDNDTLLVASIANKKHGHAVLVYGYKKISDSEYIIYVADNNYPLLDFNRTYIHKGEPVSEARIAETNKQIVSNMYVLVRLQGDQALFKYNPVVYKSYVYSGYGYNTYLPDADLRFYW